MTIEATELPNPTALWVMTNGEVVTNEQLLLPCMQSATENVEQVIL